MGGNQGDAQFPGGVPPTGGATNNGDDEETRGRRRVGLPLDSGGNGDRRAPSHRGVHQKELGNHSKKGGLLTHL